MPAQANEVDRGPALIEQVLQESEAAIVLTTAQLDDPGPQIVAASAGFCRLTQYTLPELTGRTPRILQGPLSDRAVLSRLRHCCSRAESFTGESVNYRKDRSPYLVEWCVDPVHDEGGRVTHFIAVQRDVTALRPFAQQWLESETRAREALAAASHQMSAIAEAVLVLEKTKRSFRSNELGELRKRLSAVHREMERCGIRNPPPPAA